MNRIRILIADDHPLVRSGLVSLLEPYPDFHIVGEAEDGEDAIAKAAKLKPDVVVLDLSMPKVSGIEATKIILEKHPGVKVLVLTMHENEEYVYQIFRSGASGYVLKNATKDELAKALRTVAKGEKFFSSRVSEIMIQGFLGKTDGRAETPTAPGSADGSDLLTNREREILGYVAEGLTNQQIAEILFISHRTVETHKANIMQKLEIKDSAKLVKYAVERKMKN